MVVSRSGAGNSRETDGEVPCARATETDTFNCLVTADPDVDELRRLEEWRLYDRRGIAIRVRTSAEERLEWIDADGLSAETWTSWDELEKTNGLTGEHSVLRFAWLGFIVDEQGNVRATVHESLGDGSSTEGDSRWAKCSADSCFAEALDPAGGPCFVHTTLEQRRAYFEGLRSGGRVDRLRGTYLSESMLNDILSAVPTGRRNTVGHEVKFFRMGLDLSWCTIEGGLDVQHASFGPAVFNAAVFLGPAQFNGSEFLSVCQFSWCEARHPWTFSDVRADELATFASGRFTDASFIRSVFAKNAEFAGMRTASATFNESRFAQRTNFSRAIFGGPRNVFDGCEFGGRAVFNGVVFSGQTTFDGSSYGQPFWGPGPAQFKGDASLDRVWVGGSLNLSSAKFGSPAALDEIRGGELTARGAVFTHQQTAVLQVRRADLSGSSFLEGGTLRAAGTEVVLDEVQADAPLIVTSQTEGDTPQVTSLRRATADSLVLGEVDLGRCRFFGAHQLERLRIEPSARFASVGRPFRLTRRLVIAEELDWRRANQPEHWGTVAKAIDPVGAAPQSASAVASVYRALRKGREDAGDAPGAADFYYGEMEMRRVDNERPLGERSVVWAYWLLAGYGLRASRSIAALALLLTSSSLLLWQVGFHESTTFVHSVRVSIEGSSSLFRLQDPVTPSLTHTGIAIEWALRWLGPLLIGLALLSLRGRVKR